MCFEAYFDVGPWSPEADYANGCTVFKLKKPVWSETAEPTRDGRRFRLYDIASLLVLFLWPDDTYRGYFGGTV